MKKKKEDYYYKNLRTCVDYSHRAALFLQETVENFDKKSIKERLDVMHELEQKADSKKHKMMAALSQAFITPIEREDLMALSSYLDDITDAVEEVLLQIYMCNIDSIRSDVAPTIRLLVECIGALTDVIGELSNFKHSKVMEDYIIRVNDLEEKGDQRYVENMYRLHQEENMKTVLIWRTIYEFIEHCFDTCEHAADIVETVMMKNS